MSPEEAKRKSDEALAALPPDLQETLRETFRALAANAKPRPRIESLTESEIGRLDPEDIDIAVIDFVQQHFVPLENRVSAVLSMPRGLQIFYLSFIVEAEVMNGGFNQFFWNPSSEFAELMATALHDLGATEAATLFAQAIEAFSESYAQTRLNQYDARFCEQALGFPKLRAEIIRKNQPTFFA
jgi:hypothetical protein